MCFITFCKENISNSDKISIFHHNLLPINKFISKISKINLFINKTNLLFTANKFLVLFLFKFLAFCY